MRFWFRIAHLAQANGTGDILQFAVAVGRAGEAIEGVIRNVEFHHPAPHLGDLLRLRVHHHALLNRLRAGGDQTAPAFHFNQTDATGTKRLQAVGGAQLGDV